MYTFVQVFSGPQEAAEKQHIFIMKAIKANTGKTIIVYQECPWFVMPNTFDVLTAIT